MVIGWCVSPARLMIRSHGADSAEFVGQAIEKLEHGMVRFQNRRSDFNSRQKEIDDFSRPERVRRFDSFLNSTRVDHHQTA